MQITASNELNAMLLERFQKEYSETVIANFALDMIADKLLIENNDLRAQKEDLATRNRNLMDQVQSQQNALAKQRKAK